MRKIAMILAVFAMVGANSAFAQSQQTGKGSAASCNTCSGGMPWLVGLGSLALLGTLIGVTVSSAASAPNTFGH